MTVSNGWQGTLKELWDFIAENPKIRISNNVVFIPEDVRPEFYQLFGTVRTTFIKEKLPNLLDEAVSLSESYLKTEEKVIKHLGLDEVYMAKDIRLFLHDPTDALRRELFVPLFDLLKGRVNIEAFEQKVSETIMATSRRLSQSGYEQWVALALTQLLEANRSLGVRLTPELESVTEIVEDFREKGEVPDQPLMVPMPQDSKQLSFDDELYKVFIVPDVIVDSAKTKRYVSVRTALGTTIGVGMASNASDNREWYHRSAIREKYGIRDGYGSLELNLDFTVIYVGTEPKDIALIADAEKICRPDLIIECREQKHWYEKEGLEKVRLHHNMLNPKLGTYIVSREPVSEQALNELMPEQSSKESSPEQVSEEPVSEQEQKLTPEEVPAKQGVDIHILTVGLDQSKLDPIMNVLVNNITPSMLEKKTQENIKQ